jgi:predicted dehydrogenase
MENSDPKLKVGIVGLGKMGLLHASILNVMPNVQLVALCDKSSIMRKFAKNILKKPLVTDKLEEMASLNLDMIYVTTPIPSHYSILKEVFGSIAHNVFTEKTLTTSYAQSEELSTMVEKSSGCNMVGYMKRFSVTFRKAKELLDQAVLGSLLYFDAYAYSSDFFGVQNDAVSSARGGVLEDLGSHVVDLALWYFEDLLSKIEVFPSTAPESDIVQFAVKGSNNFIGKFSVSWVQKDYRMPEFGLTIHGTEGTLDVTDSAVILVQNNIKTKFFRQDLDDHVRFYLGDSEYFREDDCFVKSVITKSKPEPSFYTATKVDYLLDQVRAERNE